LHKTAEVFTDKHYLFSEGTYRVWIEYLSTAIPSTGQ